MATTRTPSAKAARGRKKSARQALTRELIIEAALRLIGDEGLSAFSTRKLGELLGCQAMSIYHHFPSKQHLLDALVEHAIATIEVPEPGPDPIGRLRRVVYSYRAMARRWPALFPLLAVHRHNTEVGVRYLDSILRLIRAIEPDPELAARQFRALGYYLNGALLDETAGYARGPSAAEPASNDFIARECPYLTAAAPYFQPAQWDATFDFGIERLIEAFTQSAQRRGPHKPE